MKYYREHIERRLCLLRPGSAPLCASACSSFNEGLCSFVGQVWPRGKQEALHPSPPMSRGHDTSVLGPGCWGTVFRRAQGLCPHTQLSCFPSRFYFTNTSLPCWAVFKHSADVTLILRRTLLLPIQRRKKLMPRGSGGAGPPEQGGPHLSGAPLKEARDTAAPRLRLGECPLLLWGPRGRPETALRTWRSHLPLASSDPHSVHRQALRLSLTGQAGAPGPWQPASVTVTTTWGSNGVGSRGHRCRVLAPGFL